MSSNTTPEGFVVAEDEGMLETDSMPEAFSRECDLSDSSCDCPPGDEEDEAWVDAQLVQSVREEFEDGVFDEMMEPGTSFLVIAVLRIYREDDGTFGVEEDEVYGFASDDLAEEISDAICDDPSFDEEDEE